MGNRPQKTARPPMTMDEMIVDGAEQKKQSRLYKAQSLQISDDRISNTVNNTVAELISVADSKPLTLTDVKRVKEQTILYFKSCAEVSKLPSFSGLANALGLSRNALYRFMRNNPTSQTTIWLEIARDRMSDALAESSLRNDVNVICSIFLQKAMYGLQDHSVIDINATQSDNPLDSLPSLADVERKYGFVNDNELTEEETNRLLSSIPQSELDKVR